MSQLDGGKEVTTYILTCPSSTFAQMYSVVSEGAVTISVNPSSSELAEFDIVPSHMISWA